MKYKKRTSVLLGAVGLCALSLSAAKAATYTWDAGDLGEGLTFSTAANWVGDVQPPSGSDVVFDPASISAGKALRNLYMAASGTSASAGSRTFQTMTFKDVLVDISVGANSTETATTVRTLTLSGTNPGINLTDGTTATITIGRTAFGGSLVLALTDPITTMNVANSSAALVFSSGLSVTGSGSNILKTGAGTLRISTTSTAGINGFTINEGVVEVGGATTMGAAPTTLNTAFYTLNGGTLRFTSDIYSPALSANRGFTLGTNGGTVEVASGVVVKTLAKVLESSAGATFTKTGAGIFIMSNTGSNTYTGATTVAAGTLLVDSGATLASSPVTVNSGATFGGAGTVGGAVNVAGTLAVGVGVSSTNNTLGTLTINNALTLQSTAATLFELGATDYDKIRGLTNLTLDGTVTVSLIAGYTPNAGDIFQLFGWSGSIDYSNFNVLSDLILPTFADSSMSWDTSSFLTNGTIVAVPEPSTVMMMALSAGLFLWVRKVRRVAR